MSRKNPRLIADDSIMNAVMSFCGGNPGAMTALMKMITDGPAHDPDNFLGPFGPLIALDTLDIYEDKIWILYKDVCGYDTLKCTILFRANQLGILQSAEIKKAAFPTAFDFQGLLATIQERLPNFGAAGLEVAA